MKSLGAVDLFRSRDFVNDGPVKLVAVAVVVLITCALQSHFVLGCGTLLRRRLFGRGTRLRRFVRCMLGANGTNHEDRIGATRKDFSAASGPARLRITRLHALPRIGNIGSQLWMPPNSTNSTSTPNTERMILPWPPYL